MDCSDDTREAKGDILKTHYGSLLSSDYEEEEADVPPYEAYDAWTLAKEIEYLSSGTRDALFGLPNCRDIFRYFSAEEANEIMERYREGKESADKEKDILDSVQEILRKGGKKISRRVLESFYRSLEDI